LQPRKRSAPAACAEARHASWWATRSVSCSDTTAGKFADEDTRWLPRRCRGWRSTSDLLLRLARKRGTHLGGQRDRFLAAIRQQVSSQTKILGGFLVVVEVGDQLRRDRPADTNLHVFLALLQKLLQQKKRPEPRIDQTKQLERHTMAAAEIYWERAGSGLAHKASGHGVPRGIGDLRLTDIPLRDFAGGKHGKRAAMAQPSHRLLQRFQILIRRRRSAKGVHEDAVLVEFRDALEQ